MPSWALSCSLRVPVAPCLAPAQSAEMRLYAIPLLFAACAVALPAAEVERRQFSGCASPFMTGLRFDSRVVSFCRGFLAPVTTTTTTTARTTTTATVTVAALGARQAGSAGTVPPALRAFDRATIAKACSCLVTPARTTLVATVTSTSTVLTTSTLPAQVGSGSGGVSLVDGIAAAFCGVISGSTLTRGASGL